LLQEYSGRQHQVADIAHPERVTKFVGLPVMNCLSEKIGKWKKAQQARLRI
jgi:hypothetical protein